MYGVSIPWYVNTTGEKFLCKGNLFNAIGYQARLPNMKSAKVGQQMMSGDDERLSWSLKSFVGKTYEMFNQRPNWIIHPRKFFVFSCRINRIYFLFCDLKINEAFELFLVVLNTFKQMPTRRNIFIKTYGNLCARNSRESTLQAFALRIQMSRQVILLF